MFVIGVFLRDVTFLDYGYIVAFSLFILGLHFMTHPTTARRGNMVAATGMAIAVADTLLRPGVGKWGLIVLGIAIGTAVGVPAARSVKMTAMPQMVALFNGVGGGAVALISWVEFRHAGGHLDTKTLIPTLFAAIIGSISFWGSNIAFGKLQELLPGRPIMLPGRLQTLLNGALLTVAVTLAVLLAAGVTAAAAGIALDNIAMIVAGMLVGASGSILTNLMAQAMNRSIPAIVAGGFGGGGAAIAAAEEASDRTVRSTTADDVAILLTYASRVAVVPGYGMAVAQAQHAVRDLTR